MNDNVFMISPVLRKAIIIKLNKGESLKQIEDFLTKIALRKLKG